MTKVFITLLYSPLLVLYLFMPQTIKRIIMADATRWMEIRDKPVPSNCIDLLLVLKNKESRSVFLYRTKFASKLFFNLFSLIYPLPAGLIIYTKNIGKGLLIEHGVATIISAKRIGNNAIIHQQVTIGHTSPIECPTIGDNVTIGAGAKILGNITVGNNVVCGANAVVVKDVPDDCVVVGVPARIIRRNGVRVDEIL